MRAARPVVLISAVLVTGCGGDQSLPVEPDPVASPVGPAFEIKDAVHNAGNEHFFFLPPMVTAPTYHGTFDASLLPEVRVCEWQGTTCGPEIAAFTMAAGTASEIIRVDPAAQQYIVNWHTDRCGTATSTTTCTLNATKDYRIRVRVAGVELGHADVEKVSSASELKNVNTAERIPLVNGRTLPIKFRIEIGAIAVLAQTGGKVKVAAEGATLATKDATVALAIPKQAVIAETEVSLGIKETAPPGSEEALSPVYEFGPDGTTFASPALLTIAYDPAELPDGTPESQLGIYTLVDGGWELAGPAVIDILENTVTTAINHFSHYTVLIQPNGVSVNGPVEITVGQEVTLVAEVKRCDTACPASYRKVSWSTTNSAVATVLTFDDQTDSAGKSRATVRGNAIGGATVRVTLSNEQTNGSIAITVVPSLSLFVKGNPFRGTLSDTRRSLGILQNFPLQVHRPSSTGAPLVVSLSHTAPTTATTPSLVTIDSGSVTQNFEARGAAAGTDFLIATAVGHGPDTVEIVVDRGRTVVEGWPASVRVGDSVAIVLHPANPDSTVIDNAGDNTDFSLAGDGRVAFSNGTSAVATLRVPGGESRSQTYWVKGIATGASVVTLSNGNYHSNTLRTTVDPPLGFFIASMGAGGHHMCGLDIDGDAYCWGRNNFNQLGTALPGVDRNRPAAVQGGIKFTAIDGTVTHSCGLTAGHQAYCWGYGSDGRLGHGTDASKLEPTLVAGGHAFTAVTTGRDHTCAITTAGAAYCWGFGGFGALGTGRSDGNSDAPSAVVDGHLFTQIGGGYDHVCAVDQLGTAWCWGGNAFGQLGNGTTMSSSRPVQVSNLTGIQALSVAELGSHACALDALARAWCWGLGLAIGNGSFNNSAIPALVSTTETFAEISVGGGIVCALTPAGQAWCWGGGGNGGLGNGTFANSSIPVRVSGGHVFTSIAVGGLNVCGRKADGTVWCWGYGDFGGLGNGTASHSAVPVKVADPT
jgi:hypothetical protein